MPLSRVLTDCPICGEHEVYLLVRSYYRAEPHEIPYLEFDGVESLSPVGLRICEPVLTWMFSDSTMKEHFTPEQLEKLSEAGQKGLE